MRACLLAFVAGCWWLQQQARLPSWRGYAVVLGCLLVGLLARRVWRGWAAARSPLRLSLPLQARSPSASASASASPSASASTWRLASASPSASASPLQTPGLATRPSPFAVVVAVVVALTLGAGWANWRASLRMADWLPEDAAGQNVVLSGHIAGLPDVAAHGTRFLFAPDAAARAEGVPARVLLSWRDPPAALAPGQRWQLSVRLKRPRGLANPHGFDYAYWLLGEGIGATGYVRAARAGPEAGNGARIARWRAALRARMQAAMPADARLGGVLVALAIGDQRGIAQADWDIFRRTGISHLVSISGLHITMLSGAIGALVHGLWRHSLGLGRRLQRPLPLWWPARQAALVAAVATALAYGLIAGMQIPALRTVAMLSVAAVALWSGRAPPASLVLAWAAAVAVALDPWAVMAPGFWLSFGAVAVIFMVAARDEHIAARAEARKRKRDAVSPGDATSAAARSAASTAGAAGMSDAAREAGASALATSRGRAWLARMRAVCADAARVQWAVTIGLVPFSLLLFGQVSVVSALANAVAIPVVSFVVTPLSLLGAVAPLPVARITLAVAHRAMAWLTDGLAWLAQPSWAVWEAAQAGPVALALALIGVFLMLVPGGDRVMRCHGALLMVPMLIASGMPIAQGEMRVTILDVGQGTAVLVETRTHALLYDTGPAYLSGTSAGAQVVVPYLRATGVRRLDQLMVSHEDADHAGGVRDIEAALPIAARLTAAPPMQSWMTPQPWQLCEAGMSWEWDGVRFVVVHPLAGQSGNARYASNARSCVLRVATAHRSVLLTGDIGTAEERALARRDAIDADILIVPHHGSGTSSSPALLHAVAPEIAIFQLGHRNRYGHPRADVWARYAARGIHRYRTDETGAITIVTQGDSYDVSTYRQRVRRYWRDAPPAPR